MALAKGSCANLAVPAVFLLCFVKVIVAFNEDLVRINRPVQQEEEDSATDIIGSLDDVRCFCNLPVCVSTSYMCKSQGGGCFSDLMSAPSRQSAKAPQAIEGRHGCLELLSDRQHRRHCQNKPGVSIQVPSASREHPRSLLLCCFTDMCNHVDNPEAKLRLNDSFIPSLSTPQVNDFDGNSAQHENNYNAEIWFRVATIAVPIFGAIILFLLIGIAMKILRTDTMDHTIKLGDPYSRSDRHSRDHFNHIHHATHKKEPLLIHHNLESSASSRGACTNHSADADLLRSTAVPLLVQNHTGANYDNRKNETNAKLNSAYGHEYNLLHNDRLTTNNLHKTASSNVNNVYRNVNLTLGGDSSAPDYGGNAKPGATDEKLYDKQALQSVVSWPDNSNL